MQPWHSAYTIVQSNQAVLAYLDYLADILEGHLDEAQFVRQVELKGSRAAKDSACLVRGFLVEHAWLPPLQVVVELVYFAGGIRLQMATYPKYENLIQQTSFPEKTPDLIPEQSVTLSTLGIFWEGVAGPALLKSRETDLASMVESGTWRLPNSFTQFFMGILDHATP